MNTLDPRDPGATRGLPRSLRVLLGLAARIETGSLVVRTGDGRA